MSGKNNLVNKIFFRVDGYSKIGYGHLMRSMVLADFFKKKGFYPVFLSYKDNFLKEKLEQHKLEKILLKYKAGSANDLNNVTKLLKMMSDNIFIYDNYDIDINYEKQIKDHTKLLIAIDDKAKKKFHADIIINQNYRATDYKYKITNKKTKVIAGSKYVLLRNEFYKHRRKTINKSVKNILVSSGGSDFYNQSLRIVKILYDYTKDNSIKLHISVNNNFKSLLELKRLGRNNKDIILYNNVRNMAELMKKMDLAISAAGSTVWELLYIGVPTILMITTENQKDIATKLDRDSYVKNLGWHNKTSNNKILREVEILTNDYGKRLKFFKNGIRLIDGKGKERISDFIMNIFSDM